MNWVRRMLSDSEDEGRFRSGLGVVLGACIAVLPFLFGAMDAQTFLIASFIGVGVTWPLWRYVDQPLNRPRPIFAFVVLVLVAPGLILWLLPLVAIWTFLGAWTFTLTAMRFPTGWRHPLGPAPDPELNPNGVNRALVLVLVLPLLAIIGLVVWGIATERGLLS